MRGICKEHLREARIMSLEMLPLSDASDAWREV
jgi:hypothetical protein